MNEHDYDCDCLDCLIASGEVEDGATECRECGQVGGHAPTCSLVTDPVFSNFQNRMGPQ